MSDKNIITKKPKGYHGFLYVDCGKSGKHIPISRDQAIASGEKFGRGLCEECVKAQALKPTF